MTIWHLDVDRVRVVGADADGMGATELQALVAQAVRTALETAPLPQGRTVRESVEVRASSLTGGVAIAGAVAQGVTRAIGGRTHG
jgi:hypothetical protein